MVGLFGCGAAHCTDEKLEEPQVNWKVMLASRSQLKHPKRLRKTTRYRSSQRQLAERRRCRNSIKRVEKARSAL